jgi:hypothetical protein
MAGARKSADLKRDGRLALHSATVDPDLADGDAKIGGRAVEVRDEATRAAVVPEAPGAFDLFRIDVAEVVLVRVATDHLVIESWHEGVGLRQVDRY